MSRKRRFLKFIFSKKILSFSSLSGAIKILFLIVSNRKIVRLRVERIGHLILDSAILRYELGLITEGERKNYSVLIPFWESCNPFMRDCIKDWFCELDVDVVESEIIDCFLIIYSFLAGPLYSGANEKLNGGLEYPERHRLVNVLHNHNYIHRALPNSLDDLVLRKLKIFTNSSIDRTIGGHEVISLYSRDNAFSETALGLKGEKDYHSYRNYDYENLADLEQSLSKAGFVSIRLGNIKKAHNPSLFSHHHYDIDDIEQRADGSVEIEAISKSKIYVGDTSGIAAIAHSLNIPVLRYNWIPIFNSLPKRTLVCPMLLACTTTGEYLPYSEVLDRFNQSKLSFWHAGSYLRLGMEPIPTPKDLIISATYELLDRTDKNDFECKNPIQVEFELWMAEHNLFHPGLLSAGFMTRFQSLLV